MTSERTSRRLPVRAMPLLVLLSVDVAFVAAHVYNEVWVVRSSPILDISRDGSLPEVFQYLKFLAVAIVLGAAARRDGHGGLAWWSLLYAYLALDDALGIHEAGGAAFSRAVVAFGPSLLPRFARLRLEDYGELLTSAVAGAVLFGPIVVAHWRAGRDYRRTSWALAALTGLVVFFGVCVDVGKRLFVLGWKGRLLGGVLEDGGEMLAASLLLAFSLVVFERARAADRRPMAA